MEFGYATAGTFPPYVLDGYWICDYADPCLVGGGGGGKYPEVVVPQPGYKKPDHKRIPPGQEKKKAGAAEPSAKSASDFNFASTSDFDAEVELAKPLPPPRDVLIDDGIPVTPLDTDLIRTAFDAADDALLNAVRQQESIAARASALRQQAVAQQHAEWDRNALLIAVVNAALSA